MDTDRVPLVQDALKLTIRSSVHKRMVRRLGQRRDIANASSEPLRQSPRRPARPARAEAAHELLVVGLKLVEEPLGVLAAAEELDGLLRLGAHDGEDEQRGTVVGRAGRECGSPETARTYPGPVWTEPEPHDVVARGSTRRRCAPSGAGGGSATRRAGTHRRAARVRRAARSMRRSGLSARPERRQAYGAPMLER